MPELASHVPLTHTPTAPHGYNSRSSNGWSILLHDFGGYPFIFQLAAEFAERGHTVEYVYCGSNPTTPVGVGRARGRLRSGAIQLPKAISKGAFAERLLLERRYGQQLAATIERLRPELVVLTNTPIDSLEPAIRATRRVGAALVVWVQDLLGEAALRVLRRQIGPLGGLIGLLYRKREGRLLSRADHLILITDDFVPSLRQAGISEGLWTVIPNWAPLDRIRPGPKVNSWSSEQGIHDKFVFLYSGSIGFKHNPGLLLRLAQALKQRDDVIVVVNSEGPAADWLRSQAEQQRLTYRLRVNGYQPFERMPEVLASADVLLALLEHDAGSFCVPSKILSNMCAGRPQVIAVPSENLAAKTVMEAQCGIVCDPRDENGFVSRAQSLLNEPAMRTAMGKRALQYASRHFAIGPIADQFEAALDKALMIHTTTRKHTVLRNH